MRSLGSSLERRRAGLYFSFFSSTFLGLFVGVFNLSGIPFDTISARYWSLSSLFFFLLNEQSYRPPINPSSRVANEFQSNRNWTIDR